MERLAQIPKPPADPPPEPLRKPNGEPAEETEERPPVPPPGPPHEVPPEPPPAQQGQHARHVRAFHVWIDDAFGQGPRELLVVELRELVKRAPRRG